MHAAHERILYEQFKNALADRSIAVQPLLIPLAMPADPVEIGTVEENRETLAALGFDTAVLSPTTRSRCARCRPCWKRRGFTDARPRGAI